MATQEESNVGARSEAILSSGRRFSRSRCATDWCVHQQNREAFRSIGNMKSRAQLETRTTPAKSKTCKFYCMPSGCVRGENCLYAHDAGNPRKENRSSSAKVKKILVSGLPPFVDSEDLYHFFEQKFGHVLDAVVATVPSSSEQIGGRIGIITFKNEETVFAAVQANSVYLYGKKVKIEVTYGRVSRDMITSEPQELPCRRLFGDDVAPPQSPPPIQSLVNSPSLPAWAQKFKEWLPGFLSDASKRLGEGESYPLCSLKGDFRATCGMEIDHVSVGFEKLSDFIRAWPEICKAKVVPVGTGPATHIILENVQESGIHPSNTNACPPQQQTASGTSSESIISSVRAELPQIAAANQPSYAGAGGSFFSHDMILGPANTPAVENTSTAICMLCLQQAAHWRALPCGHSTLCTACKGGLQDSEAWGLACYVCQGCIEGWVSMS